MTPAEIHALHKMAERLRKRARLDFQMRDDLGPDAILYGDLNAQAHLCSAEADFLIALAEKYRATEADQAAA